MRFKEFFYKLIKEDPDDAQFMIDNEEYYPNFAEDQGTSKTTVQTLIITDNAVISAPTKEFYHEPMMWEIGKCVKENIPISEVFSVVGEPSAEDIKMITKYGIVGRSTLLNATKTISLARVWYIEEADAYAISFWRISQVSSGNKTMLSKYLEANDIPVDSAYVETLYNTEPFAEFLSNTKKQKITPQEKDEEQIIHLLPSDKKRRAMLAAGVKPKPVIPINLKYDREER
jgi:hypothetical protein